MDETLFPSHGRKQLQIWYYNYGYNNHRWIYWAVPLIAVGIFVFITAMIIFCVKRRRQARLHSQAAFLHQQPPPPAAAPVTGYPDYSTNYNAEYGNYNSVPATRPPQYPEQPAYNTPGYKPAAVEMGYPQRF